MKEEKIKVDIYCILFSLYIYLRSPSVSLSLTLFLSLFWKSTFAYFVGLAVLLKIKSFLMTTK